MSAASLARRSSSRRRQLQSGQSNTQPSGFRKRADLGGGFVERELALAGLVGERKKGLGRCHLGTGALQEKRSPGSPAHLPEY